MTAIRHTAFTGVASVMVVCRKCGRHSTGLPQSPSYGSQWRKLAGSNGIPGGWAYDKPNLYVPGFEEQFAPHGYVRIEFQGQKISEYVKTPEGANVWIGDLM